MFISVLNDSTVVSDTFWRERLHLSMAHLFKGLITTLPKNGKRHK